MDKFFNHNKIEIQKSFEEKRWDFINFQLEYIDKVENGELKPIVDKLPFMDMLERDTNIPSEIHSLYLQRITSDQYNERNYLKFRDLVIEKIIDEHTINKQSWKLNVKDIIKNELEKMGPVLENNEKSKKSEINNESSVGILQFQIRKYPELEKFGIDKDADCIKLHFPGVVRQKENDLNPNIFTRDSFSKLALKIKNEMPEIKALVAESWMLDSNKLGFTISGKETSLSGLEFWGQFVDSDGNLKKEKADKFIQTGIPEFNITQGFIKVEDFLEKYLPK